MIHIGGSKGCVEAYRSLVGYRGRRRYKKEVRKEGSKEEIPSFWTCIPYVIHPVNH